MILVVGASGPSGRAVVQQLVARGVPVRAVTRHPGRAGELAGAEIYIGDSSQPDSLDGAFDGISKLYFVPPTLPRWDIVQTRIIQQAQRAGVDHVVRISALGTHPEARR